MAEDAPRIQRFVRINDGTVLDLCEVTHVGPAKAYKQNKRNGLKARHVYSMHLANDEIPLVQEYETQQDADDNFQKFLDGRDAMCQVWTMAKISRDMPMPAPKPGSGSGLVLPN